MAQQDGYTTLSQLLASQQAAMRDIVRPVHTGPLVYSDGEKVVDILSLIPEAPNRFISVTDNVRAFPMTRNQAVVIVRAFANANSVEGACLLAGVQPSNYEDLRRVYERGEPVSTAWAARQAWKFTQGFFRACELAATISEQVMLGVIVSAATTVTVLRTTTKTTKRFTDPTGREVVYSEERVTAREVGKDTGAAKWYLERVYRKKYASDAEGGGAISVHEQDPISVLMSCIERMSALPSPALEAPPVDPEGNIIDADYSVDTDSDRTDAVRSSDSQP